MKSYKIIDMKEFDKTDYFRYFTSVSTTIEFTIKIDVTTAVKKCNRSSNGFLTQCI
jgi:chloramphenicol O-acetyltransferase type A